VKRLGSGLASDFYVASSRPGSYLVSPLGLTYSIVTCVIVSSLLIVSMLSSGFCKSLIADISPFIALVIRRLFRASSTVISFVLPPSLIVIVSDKSPSRISDGVFDLAPLGLPRGLPDSPFLNRVAVGGFLYRLHVLYP